MTYRVTALTPLLVGDGERLSPIDYMVWKDQVNVLDQRRIFKLLARGPRLEGYLQQIKKAEKLDFASWGGFAQNFAGRRIPFEHASVAQAWNRAPRDSLFIPTFAAGTSGPYLPAAAIKGSLRTASLCAGAREGTLKDIAAKFQSDRPPRRPAEAVEEMVLGAPGRSRMRAVGAGDSRPVGTTAMKVYLVRTSTIERKGNNFALGWKPTPVFAEMAAPGTEFAGAWSERNAGHRARLFEQANQHAAQVIALQRKYAAGTGMAAVDQSLAAVEERLAGARDKTCVLSIGWGGGFLSKSGWIGKDAEDQKQILRALPYYERAIASGLPFPKTRRIVHEQDRPGSMPGWVLLEVA